jgi:glycosyltransferase involved in cell wall biosynthesis
MVSVVVPVHNGSAFVRGCWETIRRQSRPPAEVVFVDDGSTDDSVELLSELPESGISRSIVGQERLGPAAARNAGIRAARSDFIAFLDVDDEWPERKLERALDCFATHPDIAVVGGLVELRFEDGTFPQNLALTRPHRRVNLGAYVFRAAVFAEFGVLDPALRYAEDIDFICRLRQGGVRFFETNDVALYYRQHGNNMTAGLSARKLGLFEALAKSLQRTRATPSK